MSCNTTNVVCARMRCQQLQKQPCESYLGTFGQNFSVVCFDKGIPKRWRVYKRKDNFLEKLSIAELRKTGLSEVCQEPNDRPVEKLHGYVETDAVLKRFEGVGTGNQSLDTAEMVRLVA